VPDRARDGEGTHELKPLFETLETLRPRVAQRTRAGLTAARARDRIGGRPRKLTPKQIEHARKLLVDLPVGEVATMFAVNRVTLYRALTRAA
jgi:DNA invertase Pin-like site-specific DNA recombinase